jgi:Spirocyclase AveC-like
MATVTAPAPAPTRPVDVTERKARPVLWFAAAGAAFVVLQVYVYIAWIATGEATRTPTGDSNLSTISNVWVIGFQVLSVTLGVGVVAYVVRQSLRERRLSFDAMLVIAWVSLYWQDPLANYARLQLFYNSHLVNYGSWVERIPGWISPNGSLLPEPILFSGGAYFWLGPMASLLAFWIMRQAKSRWPSLGTVGIITCGWLAMVALDLFAEIIFVRTQLYAYPGALHGLSIWGGERYQFPIYESVFWPMMWTAMGALRYFRDDKGRSIVERGVDRVKAVRWRTSLRVLALVGFANIGMIGYSVVMNAFALYSGQTPTGYPSYITNEQCGEGTEFACTAPDVPVPLPESGPLPPEDFGN